VIVAYHVILNDVVTARAAFCFYSVVEVVAYAIVENDVAVAGIQPNAILFIVGDVVVDNSIAVAGVN
jgi:hydrogenase maturation factor